MGESGLLRAAARRPDGLGEERVVQIATHLERAERARALYLLSLALGDVEAWDRQRLDGLYTLVQAAIARPELTGREARNLAEHRRVEAVRLTGGGPAGERLQHAPRSYLLGQDAEALARQVRLLEPLPPRRSARVAVTAGLDPGTWRVEVASRDQRGLLAVVTGVLADLGLDIVSAAAATWGDGGAIESFLVRAAEQPDAARVREAIESGFRGALGAPPMAEVQLDFDDDASPWYTLCQVRVPDRPGVLHALAVAFAASGADVHSARVASVGDVAVDSFELTDQRGRKLDATVKEAIVDAVSGGVQGRRRHGWPQGRARRMEDASEQSWHTPETIA